MLSASKEKRSSNSFDLKVLKQLLSSVRKLNYFQTKHSLLSTDLFKYSENSINLLFNYTICNKGPDKTSFKSA